MPPSSGLSATFSPESGEKGLVDALLGSGRTKPRQIGCLDSLTFAQAKPSPRGVTSGSEQLGDGAPIGDDGDGAAGEILELGIQWDSHRMV